MKALIELYTDVLSRARSLPPELIERLGCPFFSMPKNNWSTANHRIVIVGQEPFEWGFNSGEHYSWTHPDLWTLKEAMSYSRSADALAEAYVTHTYETESPSRPSAFTRAFDRFMQPGRSGELASVVSTNLFLCVLRGDAGERSPLSGSHDDLRAILEWQRGVLTRQISILQPTAVVFFTGPNYDDVIRNEFNGIVFAPVDDHPEREFARLTHQRLPECSIRIYHPGYLAQSKERRRWIDKAKSLAVDA